MSMNFHLESAKYRVQIQVHQYSIQRYTLFLGRVLFEIASCVRSFHIDQALNENVRPGSCYMFGLRDANWAGTIMEMFSRKLDKLYVENPNYPRYLRIDDANVLKEACLERKHSTRNKIQNLPSMGKAIWLSTSCERSALEIDVNHDYFVKGSCF